MIRRPHDHGVDIVASQYLFVVPGSEDLTVAIPGGREPTVEDVASGHELYARYAQRSPNIGHPHPAGPDDRDPHGWAERSLR